MNYSKLQLSNGITVVMELLPWVRSLSLGFWLKTGSRTEMDEQAGMTHLLEHMLYKGTATKSTREIAQIIDGIGGQFNAFTGRETTCFYFKVLDENFQRALDILQELLLDSAFREPELEMEKKVIIEEIGMHQDQPDDFLIERFIAELWGNAPLGRPIAGSAETVAGFTSQQVKDYLEKVLYAENIIISVTGNLDAWPILHLLEKKFGKIPRKSAPPEPTKPVYQLKRQRLFREMNQILFCIGGPGISQVSEERYATFLLGYILGEGMSSRMFQKIREELGLAYVISSMGDAYKDVGYFGFFAGVSPQTYHQTLEVMTQIIRDAKAAPPTDEEMERVKSQFKSSVAMSTESTNARMFTIARQEQYFGRYYSLNEIVDKINKITREEVLAIAQKILDLENYSLAAIGALGEDEFDRSLAVLKD